MISFKEIKEISLIAFIIILFTIAVLYLLDLKSKDNFSIKNINGIYHVKFMGEWISCNSTDQILNEQAKFNAIRACTNAGWYFIRK